MSISNEVVELLKEDFSKEFGSKRDKAHYFEQLKAIEPLFIEARKKGLSFIKISKILDGRGIKVPLAILQEFIQASTGEKKRVIKKRKKPSKLVENSGMTFNDSVNEKMTRSELNGVNL